MASAMTTAPAMGARRSSLKRDSRRHNSRAYPIKAHSRLRLVTREIASLDFLHNIPMQSETQIVHAGASRVDPAQMHARPPDANEAESIVLAITMPKDEVAFQAPGRKLDGLPCVIVRVPPYLRHKLMRMPENAAAVRQWEDKLSKEGLSSSRMFFSRTRGYPVQLFSVVKYAPEEEKMKRRRQREDERSREAFVPPRRDWRGVSYSHLLKPTLFQGNSLEEKDFSYEPYVLDDPEMVQGKHRYVLVGDANTGPVISSVMLFVRPKELKDSLNKKFREKHLSQPNTLTLSKIRSSKRKCVAICVKLNMHIATAALACMYFEKLCLKLLVSKSNRNLAMAVMGIKGHDEGKLFMSLLEELDRSWGVSTGEIFSAEFGVFAHLDFTLHKPYKHVFLNFNRLLKSVNMTPKEYLGEDMFEEYSQTVMSIQDLVRQKREEKEKLGRELRDEADGSQHARADQSLPERKGNGWSTDAVSDEEHNSNDDRRAASCNDEEIANTHMRGSQRRIRNVLDKLKLKSARGRDSTSQLSSAGTPAEGDGESSLAHSNTASWRQRPRRSSDSVARDSRSSVSTTISPQPQQATPPEIHSQTQTGVWRAAGNARKSGR